MPRLCMVKTIALFRCFGILCVFSLSLAMSREQLQRPGVCVRSGNTVHGSTIDGSMDPSIHPSMDRSMAMAVASALVSARLDYANSILFGCPQKHISRLQRVQHALARVVMQQAYRSSSTELLKQLHWLPIEWRVRFKLATSTS